MLATGVTLAVPALAGFEWSPPPPPAAAAKTDVPGVPVMPPAPPTPVESMALPMDGGPVPDTVLDTNPQDRPLAVLEAPADAGFESALPSAAPAARRAAASSYVAAPMMPRGPEAVPVPPPAPQPQAQVSPVMGAPLHASPFMKAPVRAAAPLSASSMVAFPETEGFGRDIPLALALQQIVPPGYSFAFGRAVNPGIRVSWEGGQPWNEVLQQVLAPHGLMPAIEGNVVRVQSGTAPMNIPMNAPVASPMVPSAPAYANVAAPMPVATLPAYDSYAAPVPVVPANAAVPGYDGWRPVNDWQAEGNYMPSYPRRDPAVARERMMNEAANHVQKQEPSAPGPDQLVAAAPAGMPAPQALVAAQPAQAKNYMQLTGLDDAAMKTLDAHEIRYWQAQPGESLRGVMTQWAEQAGVQLFWAEGQDYVLTAPVQMHGTFQNALVYILESFAQFEPHPQGQLHPNQPDGPAVLIIDHKA